MCLETEETKARGDYGQLLAESQSDSTDTTDRIKNTMQDLSQCPNHTVILFQVHSHCSLFQPFLLLRGIWLVELIHHLVSTVASARILVVFNGALPLSGLKFCAFVCCLLGHHEHTRDLYAMQIGTAGYVKLWEKVILRG